MRIGSYELAVVAMLIMLLVICPAAIGLLVWM